MKQKKIMTYDLSISLRPSFPMACWKISCHVFFIALPLLEMERIGPTSPFLEPSDLPTWLSKHNFLFGGLRELEYYWMLVLDHMSEANVALSPLPVNLMRFFRMAPLRFGKSEKEYWNQLNFSLRKRSITGVMGVTTRDIAVAQNLAHEWS